MGVESLLHWSSLKQEGLVKGMQHAAVIWGGCQSADAGPHPGGQIQKV